MINLEPHLQKHLPPIVEMIHELDILSPKEFKQFQVSLKNVKNITPAFQAMHAVYEAKIRLLEGNIVQANNIAILYFLRLISPENFELNHRPKIIGLLTYELSAIFLKANAFQLSYMAIETARKWTKDKKLSLVIETQLELLKLNSGSENDVQFLNDAMENLLREGLKYHFLLFQLNMIHYHLRNNQTESVRQKIETIQILNKDISYFYFTEAINIIKTRLKLQLSNTLAINQYLSNLIHTMESPYQKTSSLLLVSHIHFMNKHYYAGIVSLKNAEDIAKAYNLSHLLPTIYFNIAKALYDGFKAHEWIEYYLEKAKNLILSQKNAGLNISGKRLEIINYYNDYLKKRTTSTREFSYLSRYFSFAKGYAWKDLKYTFQYNVLMFLALSDKNWPQILKEIKLNPSTYHTIKYKLRDAGYHIPKSITSHHLDRHQHIQTTLQSYIAANHPFIWDEFNQKFEQDMIYYLLIINGGEKAKLSSTLGLSYPVIIAKTKFLELKPKEFNANQEEEFSRILTLFSETK